MKDLQLKDIKDYVRCSGIKIIFGDTGESRFAQVGDFDHYADYYITDSYVVNNDAVICIRGEI